MNKYKKILFIEIVLSFFLVGCAAVGVPLTFSPEKKITYAQTLFQEFDRPLPAQDLIEEAIKIYKDRNDQFGLAIAYQTYGDFLQSTAVGQWSKMKFFDKSVIHENRYQKALEYYKKALDISENISDYAMASSVYFSIGRLYFLYFEDKDIVCDSFSKSIEKHLMFRRNNPNTKLILPQGYNNFVDYVNAAQKQAGCL